MPELRRPILIALAFALGLGCPTAGDPTDDDDAVDDDDSADDDDAGDDDDAAPTFPETPLPFTLDLSGGLDESVTVDTFGSCQNYNGSSDFRQQWAAGTWALRVQVTGSYTGPGTYDASTGVLVTLLRNVAGGESFQAGGTTAHAATLVMEGDDGTNAWGSVTIDGMTDQAAAGGTVTVTPPVIPLWCPSVQH